jgi:uncharacterized protein with PIN domain
MTRFIVDVMLGTLAKWLRVLGFDALYAEGRSDDDIVKLAEEEQRVLLTRDKELCGRVRDSLYIETTELDEQIAFITGLYSIDETKILNRCLLCNTPLEPSTKEEASGHVPPGVLERESEFWRCPRCDKYYWPATHYEKMKERAQSFLGPSR